MSDAIEAVTRRLDEARTAAAVAEMTVEAAAELLDADACELLLETDDRLVVEASSAPLEAGTERSYPISMGIPGTAYATGTARIIEDRLETRSVAADDAATREAATDPRSLCCAPIERHGLLLARAAVQGAFDDADLACAKQLAALAGAALDRLAQAPTPALANGGSKRDHVETDQLDEVADILSHDIRNALNVAQGNLELARETGERETFDRAAAALDRIEALVEEVVVLARTESVGRTMAVDIHEAVEAAWENVGTGESTLLVDDSVSIVANDRAVVHIFENLIENAVDHAGPTVTVRVGTTDDGFYFEDDGPGIPPDHREQVFERGFSLVDGNTGLGLRIVKRIVEAQGWTVDVETSADGGARFVFGGVEPTDP